MTIIVYAYARQIYTDNCSIKHDYFWHNLKKTNIRNACRNYSSMSVLFMFDNDKIDSIIHDRVDHRITLLLIDNKNSHCRMARFASCSMRPNVSVM